MTEEWKPVVGLEGLYAVSNLGRLKNIERKVGFRKGRGPDPEGIAFRTARERVRVPYVTADGYHQFKLPGFGVILVHVLILRAFVGPCPEGMESCHGDGDPGNNRLENLRWDTPKANGADKVAHGRSCCGERQGAHKLSEQDVLEIRKRAHCGQSALARSFHVTEANIRRILRRETWRHLP